MGRDMVIIWLTEKEYEDISYAFGDSLIYADPAEKLGDFLRKRRVDYMWPELVAPEGTRPEAMPIDWLRLSERSRGIIVGGLGIRTCGELAAYSGGELLALRNFGAKSLAEVRQALELRGMRLRRGGRMRLRRGGRMRRNERTPAGIGRAIGADFEAVAERCGMDVHALAAVMRRPLMRTRKPRGGSPCGRPSMEELSSIWQAIRAEQEDPSYVDARSLAESLGVPKHKVQGWIRRGRLHAVRSALDGHLRIPAEEVRRIKEEEGGKANDQAR